MPVIFKFKGAAPSNKTIEYGLQLSAIGYGYKSNIEGKVNVLSPKLDKLSVTLPVDETDKPYYNEVIKDLPKHEGVFKATSEKNQRYKQSINWTDPVTGEAVLLQCEPTSSKTKNHIRFELNPDKLGPDGMSRFKEMFNMTLSVGNYPYSKVIEHGRVTRADIAVDMINVPVSRLIAKGVGSGKAVKFLGLTGKMETHYLDKPKSNPSQKKLYDKLQQQSDQGHDLDFGGANHTRIEFTHQNGPLKNLGGIHNPFKTKIGIIDPIIKPDVMEDWTWELFLNSCRLKGIEPSLTIIPEEMRKPATAALDKAKDLSWRPEVLWTDWDDYLMKSGVLSED